jgi:Flp pilus assembly protein TadG
MRAVDMTTITTNQTVRDERSETQGRASKGQILILFAFFLTAMVGVLALAVDLGVSFTERRAMQNSADAAALAGARIVAKAASTSGLTALPNVTTVANQNKMNIGTLGAISCSYVNDSDGEVGSCSGTPPASATGVKVTVTETHPTFFIRAVPGGPKTVQVSATATAHVLKPTGGFSDGPFIVCGSVDPNNKSLPSILIQSGGKWVINPSAINKTYLIHGPQINDCAAKADRFKGLADQDDNSGKSANDWFGYDTGVKAGPTRTDVDGINGCQKGQAADNCVIILPVAIDNPPEQGNSKSVWVVAFVPFFVKETGANTHTGTVLSNYIVYAKGQTGAPGWTPGYTGPIVIRLTS